MDHHRIERVFDLVRHAGRELSERRELLRVRQVRAESRELLHIACADHDAGDAALVAQDLRGECIDDRASTMRDLRIARAYGLAVRECLRHDIRDGVVPRQ